MASVPTHACPVVSAGAVSPPDLGSRGLTACQRRALPPFSALRALEAVGTCGGIRRAATALCVDHASVSRQLRLLERWIGIPLIDRSSHSAVCLTRAGLSLYEAVARALGEIAQSSLELSGSCDERHLTVWCEPSLASEWLAGKLCDYLHENPGLDVSLRPMDGSAADSSDPPDVQIHYVPAGDVLELEPMLRSVPIAHPCAAVVAGTEFAASSLDIRTPGDLLHYRLLHEGDSARWRGWFEQQGVPVDELPGPRFWYGHLTLAAARRNRGIALSNSLLASSGIGNGELIELGCWPHASGGSYHFAAPENRWSAKGVSRFRAWLMDVARGQDPVS